MKYNSREIVEYLNDNNRKAFKWFCFFDKEQYDLNIRPQKVGVFITSYSNISVILEDDNLNEIRFNTDKLFFFDKEEECNEHYNNLVFLYLEKINDEIKKRQDIVNSIEPEFINTDYVMEKLRRSK